MCVFVSLHSFLPPHKSRPQNIGTYGFTATRKNPYLFVVFAKMLCSEDGIIRFTSAYTHYTYV